mmetsp:Transcript_66216/g.163063  ORF Transcript_66216/g.163063 Transcript_66216/m.163063 type:complete len:223 (-) Transcript_66216:184-852(-)
MLPCAPSARTRTRPTRAPAQLTPIPFTGIFSYSSQPRQGPSFLGCPVRRLQGRHHVSPCRRAHPLPVLQPQQTRPFPAPSHRRGGTVGCAIGSGCHNMQQSMASTTCTLLPLRPGPVFRTAFIKQYLGAAWPHKLSSELHSVTIGSGTVRTLATKLLHLNLALSYSEDERYQPLPPQDLLALRPHPPPSSHHPDQRAFLRRHHADGHHLCYCGHHGPGARTS